MKDEKITRTVQGYTKDVLEKAYQKPEITDLGKVSEQTFASDPDSRSFTINVY